MRGKVRRKGEIGLIFLYSPFIFRECFGRKRHANIIACCRCAGCVIWAGLGGQGDLQFSRSHEKTVLGISRASPLPIDAEGPSSIRSTGSQMMRCDGQPRLSVERHQANVKGAATAQGSDVSSRVGTRELGPKFGSTHLNPRAC
jgi:hypothetical protein